MRGDGHKPPASLGGLLTLTRAHRYNPWVGYSILSNLNSIDMNLTNFQVLNKVDLLKPGEVDSLVQLFESKGRADVVIPTAAKLGQGVAEVREWASQQLQAGPSLYPKVDLSSRNPPHPPPLP